MPIDNVQRFERLCEDALYLQVLADKDADVDEINALTEILDKEGLIGFPVSVTGGLIEVDAIDSNLENTKVFVRNDEVIGQYYGLNWRPQQIEYPDGTSSITWRLCHAIGSQIDQMAFDDEMGLNEKAERISKFFRIPNASERGPKKASEVKQRVSYLNELGIFEDALVCSPVAIRREEDNVLMLKSSESGLIAKIVYVSLDEAVTVNGEWIEGTTCLSYEVEIPEFGNVSIPHIPKVTKIYDIF